MIDVYLFQIRQLLFPLLLLATTALSSSNVLPLLSINKLETEPVTFDSQQSDNIFSNKYQPRNILNDIFYTVSIAASSNDRNKLQFPLPYVDDNNKIEDDPNASNNNEKYNGEGFRKEQWHNYPRQLDRLHKYLYEHHNADKRNPDPDDPNISNDYTDDTALEYTNDLKANELRINTNDDTRNGYDTVVAVTNPLLIFKIRLACLSNEIKNSELDKNSDLMVSEPEYVPGNRDDEKYLENAINPQLSVTKVKREEISPQNAPVSGIKYYVHK